MFEEQQILAVVPARSGSKGIADKNMQLLEGVSLIGWAGRVLSQVDFLDAKVIFTDSAKYAEEGRKYGLDAPFLRPKILSRDDSGAVETILHALLESEKYYQKRFDVILIIEPTSPLRKPQDVERAVRQLVMCGADSVVSVSPLSHRAHPNKILAVQQGKLQFFQESGEKIESRQVLQGQFYWRNGVCYALTRHCLVERKAIFTERTLPDIIDRPVVNIDDALDLTWAEFLLKRAQG